MGLMNFLSIASLFMLPVARGDVTWTATPFNPPAVPLAVRTPYLSAWLPQGSGAALNARWPTFWTGSTLGWAGFIRVDGTAYSFLGDPAADVAFTKATQKSFEFTATQSTFVLSAGPVDLTVNFLSPVEPKDLVKQSLPLSYLTLSAVSTDGNSHQVEAYTDISAEWVSGDNGLKVNWTTTTGDILTHQAQLTSPINFAEINDKTQYGSVYYSTSSSGTTFESGADKTVRTEFLRQGKLPNTQDTNFRAISDNWPVFAFAHNLGSVSATATTPVVISIGHARDPVVQYIVADGSLQPRHAYFWTKYASVHDAISFFLGDYSNALSTASSFDSQINTDANKISNDYASIVKLSVRQALAAIEITASKGSDGSYDTNDVIAFMKEISSNGNMNTIDVIFPAMPIFLYTNPDLLKYLLLAEFKYQASGRYPNAWSIHDMGAHYPNATGHDDGKDEAMPVEESGNMLIMTLEHYRRTNDDSLIKTYPDLLDRWTQFLITDSLIPAHQLSTDDFAGELANQTNLAIKGIVGIGAMAEIAKVLGDNDKSANYTSIAQSYVPQWRNFAQSKAASHLTLAYNNDSSWGLTYNLFGDKLLKLNLFPQEIYEQQTAWYKTVAQKYGVPLDTRHTYTKSDWEIWTAAIATDTEGRDLFISSIKNYLSSGVADAPFSDWYETKDARVAGFRARPVAGGHLAFLILDQ